MDTLTQLPHTPGDNFYIFLAFLVATYELVARFVPTVKDFTILGFLYRFLFLYLKYSSLIYWKNKMPG